ncbi:alpha/beta fold hydrolase [Desulfobulbus sp. N2]|nr:alpha/beta fold hydrolase [Desulfobulbus sp. US4]MCW5204483.1 alpha/beta fold hydrolase [Desulfobulbus sp. N2]
MKAYWLHQQGNQDCLLFMAGWGMCPEPFYEIHAGSVDVLMLYDYRSMAFEDMSSALEDLQRNLQENFQKKAPYRKIHLLAWSMGVWAASMLFANKTFSAPDLTSTPASTITSAIAIGGTCHPIHDKLGIPENNFTDMAKRLSPARLEAFQRSMFADEQQANRFATSFRKGERSLEEVHQELLALATAYTTYTTDKVQSDVPNIYTSRIVTGRDRIFPARNQVRAWGRKQCRTLSLPHFPFYHWPSWSTMIEEVKN